MAIATAIPLDQTAIAAATDAVTWFRPTVHMVSWPARCSLVTMTSLSIRVGG